MRSSKRGPVDWVDARGLGRALDFPKILKNVSLLCSVLRIELAQSRLTHTLERQHPRPGPITVVSPGDTPFQLLFNAANGTHRDIFSNEQLWGESAPGNNTIYTFSNSDYASPDFDVAIGRVQYGLLPPEQVLRLERNWQRRRGGV